MRYIVYGAGAIGATIGTKPHQSNRDVALIARENGVENEPLALRRFPQVYGIFVYLAAERSARLAPSA
jgi:ketopantoate reductase